LFRKINVIHWSDPVEMTFQDSGEHALLFLTLLERELRRESERFGRFLHSRQGGPLFGAG